MSQANKDLVRRWFEEVWNKGRTSAIDELFAANGVFHGLGEEMRGPDAFKPFYVAYRGAFPDVNVRIDDIIAEGDVVALRWTCTATHRGGTLGFAATERRIEFTGMGFARIANGKLVEGWNNFDRLGMFEQLGIVNVPQPS